MIKACGDLAAPNPSCCTSLNNYIVGIQKQMLITNKQAINCATLFGSMLQKGGVLTDIYELCDVDLKDFSLQGTLSFHVSLFLYFFLQFNDAWILPDWNFCCMLYVDELLLGSSVWTTRFVTLEFLSQS